MKRSNVSIIVYLCLVFLSGMLVGSIGFKLYNARSVSASLKTNPCTPEAARSRYLNDMQTRLQLRPEQIDKLTVILEDTHQRFRALREKYKPEVKVIQEEQAASIRTFLDEPQKAEYEKMRLEREQADRARDQAPPKRN